MKDQRHRFRWGTPLIVLGLLGFLSLDAMAQGRLKLGKVSFDKETASPGDEVTLSVEVTPQFGWHIYGKKETIGVRPSLSLNNKAELEGILESVGELDYPDGTPHDSVGTKSYWLEGKVTLRQRFKVAAATEATSATVKATLTYMACTPAMCDPPMTMAIEGTLAIGESSDKNSAEKSESPVLKPRAPMKRGHLSLGNVSVSPAKASPGDEVTLNVEVIPDFGWHIYGKLEEIGTPPSIEFLNASGLDPLGDVDLPDGEPHDSFGMKSYWLEGKTVLKQKLRVPKDAEPGVAVLDGDVNYIACDHSMCDPPKALPFITSLEIVEASSDLEQENAETPPTEDEAEGDVGDGGHADSESDESDVEADGEPEESLSSEPIDQVSDGASGGDLEEGEGTGDEGSEGLVPFMLAAFFAGLLALAMPCTYPMIPITISFFTKQADDRGGNVLPLSMAYGAGIVSIFIAIGVSLGPLIIPFAVHPITNLIIGLIFVVFACSLFGLFELKPPKFLTRSATKASMHGGYVGVFLMGMALVVTSFTCTMPFVGSLLAAGASTGDMSRVALGMAVFGATMAIPFVGLSLVPNSLQKLPKGGDWGTILKVSLGFVELAAALKFFSNAELVWQWKILPRELFLTIWAAIFLSASLFLLGVVKMKGESGVVGPGRLLAGIVAMIMTLCFAYGSLGYKFDNDIMLAFEPPYTAERVGAGLLAGGGGGGEQKSPDLHEIVVDDFDQAVTVASQTGKAVLINFTGHT